MRTSVAATVGAAVLLGSFAMAFQASATTFFPAGNVGASAYVVPAAGDEYTGTFGSSAGPALNHTYTFTVSTRSQFDISGQTNPNGPKKGVKNMQWIFNGGAPNLVTNATGGQTGIGTISYIVNAGVYVVSFAGTFLSGGGTANENVFISAVPLPPALLLFGSALVAAGASRRKRKALAAA
jgi:hypothetical protein